MPCTARAAPLNPLTLNAIQGANGIYVVGLKSNQAHLYRYCLCNCLVKKADYDRRDAPKRGHGRLEQRSYQCFSVSPTALAPRWKEAGLSTLIRVKRIRQTLAGSQQSTEMAYFLSNRQPANQQEADELFDAIRHHWRIEAMHHQRDVTLAEDDLRTGSEAISRLMSSLRTLTIILLRRAKPKNMAAQLDEFADNFHTLIQFMTQQLVL
jgi:predicted transposase YbfD/YdcC